MIKVCPFCKAKMNGDRGLFVHKTKVHKVESYKERHEKRLQ